MRPWHVIAGLCASFLMFFAGLAIWFSFDEKMSEPGFRSEASQMASSDRTFGDSVITSKVDQVADEPSALFNDPAIKQAWGLKKTDAARAWSVTHGSRDIKVCIIDTGIDVNHEDLRNNLWRNPGESGKDSLGRDKATNGIDDDGNGLIDDVHGWSFVNGSSDLTDNHGHGTHIAGIIGAEAGNGKGITGISPQVSLMIVKYYDPKVPNADNLKNTILSIRYCVAKGAHIINYSGGGTEYSQEEHDAVEAAERKGILFIAAAGNEKSNSDQFHYYPADYKLSNIISVTAIDPSTQVLSSSNYGTETVDIAAPGQNILSTLPGNSYGPMTGTSQATAFVSGAAALIMASKPAFKMEDVKKYILATGDATTSLSAKTRTSRQLNLFKALTILDSAVMVSGAIVSGGSASDSLTFTLDPNNKPTGTPQGDVTRFGRNLMDMIQKNKKKERLGTKQDP